MRCLSIKIGFVLVLLFSMLACGIFGETVEHTETVGQDEAARIRKTAAKAFDYVAATAVTTDVSSLDPGDDAGLIKMLVTDYWAAYSVWDKKSVDSMLEENYRAKRGPIVRQAIGKLQWFRGKACVKQTSTPKLLESDVAEMDIEYGECFPGEDVASEYVPVKMTFLKVDGTWMITNTYIPGEITDTGELQAREEITTESSATLGIEAIPMTKEGKNASSSIAVDEEGTKKLEKFFESASSKDDEGEE